MFYTDIPLTIAEREARNDHNFWITSSNLDRYNFVFRKVLGDERIEDIVGRMDKPIGLDLAGHGCYMQELGISGLAVCFGHWQEKQPNVDQLQGNLLGQSTWEQIATWCKDKGNPSIVTFAPGYGVSYLWNMGKNRYNSERWMTIYQHGEVIFLHLLRASCSLLAPGGTLLMEFYSSPQIRSLMYKNLDHFRKIPGYDITYQEGFLRIDKHK